MDTTTARTGSRIASFLVRASFVYWILWGIPWVLQQFARLTQTPGMGVRYWRLWNPITGWVGTRIVGFEDGAMYTDLGSGDSTFFWTLAVVHGTIALAIAAAWTLFAQHAGGNRKLNSGLVVGLRVLFALVLIEYGAAKVIPIQFPTPRLELLATPLGELPPESLLWAFMGASPLYTAMAGAVEMLGGALLLFRRTARAGALLGILAIGNVLALNIGYDVPVKLFSIHLIAIGVWIFAPAAPKVVGALLERRQSGRPVLATAVPIALLLIVSGLSLRHNAIFQRTYGDLAPRPPLYGRYRISEITAAEPELPSSWQHGELLVPAHRGPAQVRLPDRRVQHYRLEIDTISQSVIVRSPAAPKNSNGVAPADTILYRHTKAGLHIVGRIGLRTVDLNLDRIDSDTLPLLGQRLRWIR